MMIQSFKCDFPDCGKEFKARLKDGQAAQVGGVRGVIMMPDKSVNGIELDFCEECWAKVIKFIFESNKSKIIKPNGI